MKKKIMFVANHFGMGGLEKVNVYLGNYLADHESIEVVFFSLNEHVEVFYDMHGLHQSLKVSEGWQAHLHKFYKKSMAWLELQRNHGTFDYLKYYHQKIMQVIAFAKKQAVDTIIVNAQDGTAMLPLIKQELPQVNCIAWMHNNHERYLSNQIPSYKCLFLPAFFNGLQAADQVVCLTREDVSYFSKFNANTLCIHNPITLKTKGRADLSSVNISYIGRIDMLSKGLDYLAKIAQTLPAPWKIVFAGKGEKQEEAAFKKLINKKAVKDKIKLIGAQQDEGLKKLLENSSIYLMTSRWEGFGLVLVEAMSFGLPVIAFDQVGSREVLDYGKAGILVAQGNLEEFNSKLKALIESRELREEYAQRSLNRAKDFEIAKIANQWLDIL